MTKDTIRQLIKKLPDEELPSGHMQRFQKRLQTTIPLQQKLWSLQRYLTAASVAVFIAGTLLVFANRERLFFQGPFIANNTSGLNETEIYLKNEIDSRIQLLTSNDKLDRQVISDLYKEDKSFRIMLRDLKKNPGDIRLTCALIETYQLKMDLLDEMIEKER